jgi:hypothetical protein
MSARAARGVCVVALLAAAGAGCERPPPVVSLRQGVRTYRASDYDAVLDRWTRSSELIELQGVDARIAAAATYFSWDFRSAYNVRFAFDARLSDADRAALFERSRQEAEQSHEFYVALTTTQVRWGQLNRPSSAWQIRLIDDRGREVHPSRVVAERRQTPADRSYFPFVTPWRQVFQLFFPRRAPGADGTDYEVLGPDTRYFVLRFSGPLGALDLRWDVARDG